jgi:hypothetical protein
MSLLPSPPQRETSPTVSYLNRPREETKNPIEKKGEGREQFSSLDIFSVITRNAAGNRGFLTSYRHPKGRPAVCGLYHTVYI